MAKKNILIILVALAFFIFFLQINNERIHLQKQIDILFITSLEKGIGELVLDYNSMEEEAKEYFYVQSVAGLRASSNLVYLTSYKNNRYLKEAIEAFEQYITDPDKRNSFLGSDNQVMVYNKLLEIRLNPSDEKTAKEFKTLLLNLDSD